jgi:hypothetical protein
MFHIREINLNLSLSRKSQHISVGDDRSLITFIFAWAAAQVEHRAPHALQLYFQASGIRLSSHNSHTSSFWWLIVRKYGCFFFEKRKKRSIVTTTALSRALCATAFGGVTSLEWEQDC